MCGCLKYATFLADFWLSITIFRCVKNLFFGMYKWLITGGLKDYMSSFHIKAKAEFRNSKQLIYLTKDRQVEQLELLSSDRKIIASPSSPQVHHSFCRGHEYFNSRKLVQVSNGLLPDAAAVPSSFLAADVTSH